MKFDADEKKFDAQVEALAAHERSFSVATAVTRIGGNTWDGRLEIWQWPSRASEEAKTARATMDMACGLGDLTWMHGDDDTPILAVAKDDGDIEILCWCANSMKVDTGDTQEAHGPIVSQSLLQEHHDLVNSVSACSTNANLLASGSSDASLKIWDINEPDGSLQSYNACHKREIYGVAWNDACNSVLATASADKTVKLWDMRVGSSCAARSECPFGAECLSWQISDSGNNCLLVGLDQGTVVALDQRKIGAEPLWTTRRHTARVGSIVTGKCRGNVKVLASCGDDCRTVATLTNAEHSDVTEEIKLDHGDYARGVVFMPLPSDRLGLAAGGWDGQVQLIEL